MNSSPVPEVLLQLFHVPRAVEEECTAVNKLLNHVVLADVSRVVACYEVCSDGSGR